MQALWHHFYGEADAVLFVVNASAGEQAAAAAAAALHTLAQYPQLQVSAVACRGHAAAACCRTTERRRALGGACRALPATACSLSRCACCSTEQ